MRDVAECRQAKATSPKPAAIRDSIFPLAGGQLPWEEELEEVFSAR